MQLTRELGVCLLWAFRRENKLLSNKEKEKVNTKSLLILQKAKLVLSILRKKKDVVIENKYPLYEH